MPAPSAWVDALFDRLSARYGVAFLRQYGDLDAAVVKADWAGMLHGLSPQAIRCGLENLPERPPHAGQFRRLCLEHLPGEERRNLAALPAPTYKPTPEQLERLRKSCAQLTRKFTAEDAQ